MPTGTILHFNGAGSATIGNSQVSPIATDPFAGTTPGTVCDFASTCTVATAASSCSHAPLGFSSCATYPDNLGIANGTSGTQVALFSAQASTGLGAVCFASGTATATSCVGTTSTAFFNLGIKGNTAAGTYATTVINIAVSSGP